MFTNKVAIITGASSGIGAATAIALSKEGAKVALVARNETKLNQVADQCVGDTLVIKADISKDEDCRKTVQKTIARFRQLDLLVNNAGISRLTTILDDNFLECFDQVLNTNLRPAALLTHLAAPHLVKSKGVIVNISSVQSLCVPTVETKGCPYAVSKAGLDHLTRCAALELAPHGVRVNSINPGPVRTDIFANTGFSNPEEVVEALRAGTALNRVGEPEEIADLVLFLASEKARSITGSIVVSDNGYILK